MASSSEISLPFVSSVTCSAITMIWKRSTRPVSSLNFASISRCMPNAFLAAVRIACSSVSTSTCRSMFLSFETWSRTRPSAAPSFMKRSDEIRAHLTLAASGAPVQRGEGATMPDQPSPPDRGVTLFLSYSREDEAYAGRLAGAGASAIGWPGCRSTGASRRSASANIR